MVNATRIGATLAALMLVCACGTRAASAHDGEDVAFARNMAPHHQQAVDMAAMVPGHTANPTMHVIAANMAADQRAEIGALDELLKQWGADDPAGTTRMGGMAGMVDQATMTRLATLSGPDFDRLWLSAMIGHHQGAVTMAQAEVARGEDRDAIHMARLIITAQQREIAYMTHLLSSLQ